MNLTDSAVRQLRAGLERAEASLQSYRHEASILRERLRDLDEGIKGLETETRELRATLGEHGHLWPGEAT